MKNITNPNLSEIEKLFLKSTLHHGGPLFESDVPNGHWEVIQEMTKYFGVQNFDLDNKYQVEKFLKSGWIHFGVINNTDVNAVAFKQNGYQFIGLYLGTLYFIRDTFLSLFSQKEFLPKIGDVSMEDRTLDEFKNNFIKNRKGGNYFQLQPKCEIRKNAADILTDLAINFVYYHEVSHLVYCHTDYFSSVLKIDELVEFPLNELSSDLSLDKKAFELEADRSASEYNLLWLKMMNEKGFGKPLKGYNLFFIWITTIETVFKILNPTGTFEEKDTGTHPNNFIRIFSLVLHTSNFAKKINLIDDTNESYSYLQASIDLQKNIFNPIGFLPVGGSSEENLQKMKAYQKRCDSIFENTLKELCKKRVSAIKKEFELLTE